VKAGGTADGDVHELHGEGLVTYITDPAGLVFGVKQPAATDTML
jgi:predicted enzyme related to lactoylglutathione lyase